MPDLETFLGTWSFDPVAAVVLTAALVAYLLGVRRVARLGTRWPVGRGVAFVLGALGTYAVVSFGFLGTESRILRWAFVTRVAVLLLVVPLVALLGRPLDLARAALPGPGGVRLQRFVTSRPARLVGNAVVAPVVACALFCVFLTPLAGGWRTDLVADEATGLLLPVLGLLLVLPVAAHTGVRSEVFIVAEFGFVFVELVLDAVPGLVLRLSGQVLDGVGAVAGTVPRWFPGPLADQHWAGDLLWSVAEVADLPVLALLFVRWFRSDRHRARAADALSEAELEALVRDHLGRGR